MRRALVILLTSLSGLCCTAGAQAQSGLTGEWWTPGFNARVRIEPCGDAVCGRIVWLWDETPKDIADKNPLIGRVVIDSMSAAEPGRWRGGRLYNPEDGRDYKGSLHLQSPTRLVVDGCVLFVCRTQVWRRAEAGRCPPVAPL
jgi:uncharacterized protein (DUF2147 family)